MSKIRLLHADKEQNNLIGFSAYFRRNAQYEITICDSPIQVIEHVNKDLFHIAVIDQFILDEIGIDFFQPEPLRKIILIAVSASRDLGILERALQEGKIFKYHSKPFHLDDLNKTIEDALLHLI